MKRAADEIMDNINPIKSKKRYDDEWSQLITFFNLSNTDRPTEEQFIVYFNHLKNVKKYAASSIWSKYSRINVF